MLETMLTGGLWELRPNTSGAEEGVFHSWHTCNIYRNQCLDVGKDFVSLHAEGHSNSYFSI